MSFEEACKKHGGNLYVKLLHNQKKHEYKTKPIIVFDNMITSSHFHPCKERTCCS